MNTVCMFLGRVHKGTSGADEGNEAFQKEGPGYDADIVKLSKSRRSKIV